MAYLKEQFLQEREYQEQEKQEQEIIQKHYGLEQVNGINKAMPEYKKGIQELTEKLKLKTLTKKTKK